MPDRALAWIKGLFLSLGTVVVLGLSCPSPKSSRAEELPKTPPTQGERLSGPYTYQNLTIYLIHGTDQWKGKTLLTLDEALKQKKVIVHETGNVNQLTIENQSTDSEVFIQSGDIIKGGRQDRMLASDVILPSLSGKVPVVGFCVESGRWRQRGAEMATQFASSRNVLASQGLRLSGGQLGQIGAIGMLGGVGNIGAVGQARAVGAPPGQLSQIGQLGMIGQLGHIGQLGGHQIGQIGGLGQIGMIGVIGIGTPPPFTLMKPTVKITTDMIAASFRAMQTHANWRTVTALAEQTSLLLDALPTEAERNGQSAVWREVATLQSKLQHAVGTDVKGKASASSLQLTLENDKVLVAADRYVKKLLPHTTQADDTIGYLFVINGQIKSGDVYGSHALFETLWPKQLQATAVEALAEHDPALKVPDADKETVARFLAYAAQGLPFSQDIAQHTRVTLRPRTRALFFETIDPQRKEMWIHRSYMNRMRESSRP